MSYEAEWERDFVRNETWKSRDNSLADTPEKIDPLADPVLLAEAFRLQAEAEEAELREREQHELEVQSLKVECPCRRCVWSREGDA